ncbi:unnamed protein product [Orchesella dallaii]|uniref:Uncharacterized protein n=1 Tax=Orchesella dallaii TaxID=48710 RepID=A0ABP1RG28_9HEXA
MSGVKLSRTDSERIYLEILRLEKEREEAKAKEKEKIKVLTQARFENDVGRKFFGKVMAKKKARIQQEQQQSSDKKDDQQSQQQQSQDDQPSSKELSRSSEPVSPASIVSIFASSSGIGCGDSSIASGDNQGSIPDKGALLSVSTIKIENELVPPPPPRTDKPQPPTGLVCPPPFRALKVNSTFTLKFAPPECCGGPRLVDIQSSTTDRILYTGIIDSDTEVFLQNPSNTEEKILTYKLDVLNNEWAISFPGEEEPVTVAYLIRPKPATKISPLQIYEIESADGYSHYFNLGIEMEKTGSSRRPDFVFRMLNDSLHPVATIILLSNFKAASVTIEESLWPSQKAIILGTGILMIWELVQGIRRKATIIKNIIVGCIILTCLIALIAYLIYESHREIPYDFK